MNKSSIIVYSMFATENFFRKHHKIKRPFSVCLSTIQDRINFEYITVNIKRLL